MTLPDEDADKVCVDAFPTSISDLHFSANTHNFSSTLSSLKRSTLSRHNRLQSILHDSHFVQSTASRLHLPLIANERCGSWYIPPEKKTGSAYFKSTDGHFGEWAFSTRRLNLQILETIATAGGCVIVDSTRRGKSMPDALSKTVPIWCTVLNRFLFPELRDTHQLRTPARAVGSSEHFQMETRLKGFVEDLSALRLDIESLRTTVRKPLRPLWITPESEDMTLFDSMEYNRIICCTASSRVEGSEMSENGYIQGAADDHEAWSQGLTPSLFWKYRDEFLQVPEEEFEEFVRKRKSEEAATCTGGNRAVRIHSTGLYIASLSDSVQLQEYDGLIIISSDPFFPQTPTPEPPTNGPKILQIQCKQGKLGSRALRTQLKQIIPFLEHIVTLQKSPPNILIMCYDGKDLSVGVALTILCLLYDDEGQLREQVSWESINKASIRQRLATITTAKPEANPSRATLQSVHAFLMP